MKILLPALAAAASLMAGAALADDQPARTDQIKRDDDPYVATPQQTPAPVQATVSTDTGLTPTQTRQFVSAEGVNVTVVHNSPIPDTAENRARYGKPLSRAGQRSPARGN